MRAPNVDRRQAELNDQDLERRIQRMERDVIRGNVWREIWKAEAEAARLQQPELKHEHKLEHEHG